MASRTKTLALALVWSACALVSGCQPVERTARDSIAAAKGALDGYKVEYHCAQAQSSKECTIVANAVSVKDLAIDALEVYCAGPAFDSGTGPCQPSPDKDKKKLAAVKLQALTNQLNQIMRDIQPLLKPGGPK